MVAYIELPVVAHRPFWALGVWGALAGSMLLLLRSRRAVTAFAASLVGLAVSTGYQLTHAVHAGIDDPQAHAKVMPEC
jgi:hypothetical protein